jgi:hypothetical protein
MEKNLRRFPYKEGSHNNQKAKTTVNEFPDSNDELTKEEKGAYKAYKNTLSPERKKELEDTDGLVDQPCVLQYISRNPRPTLNRPYGTVSYVNAKSWSGDVANMQN